ncbi:hypothetical protein BKA00_006682 [Actinomadura coerulea]|uniref:Uncharacterized protein n=1 Tax=Actinomadura coerulea TaxID=46159 RepID=A0A7X0L2L4_9ACTN|nr:hypothetical protein [Actinomadura coerulea]MBB6399768.1 hypothetical protein [Actinomadura coerulea]GGQ15812.1 hypothetical protein GCM10010187_35010 [Actinomadura coerulea]
MVRVLGAWGAALAVWLLGFSIVARLAAGAGGGGEPLSDLDRILRLDLPWILVSVSMVVVAGAVQRDRTRRARWLASVLAVPLLALLAGVAAPVGGDADALSAVLYVAEGVAGAAGGLALAALFGAGREELGGYW